MVSQPVNAGSGWLYGFEFAYFSTSLRCRAFLGALGLSANYSYTDSQASGLPGRSDSPSLLRQAPNTWNISPTFDHGRLSIRVGMTYNAASIYSYQYQDGTDGSTPTPVACADRIGDNYLYPHFQLDVQGSFRLETWDSRSWLTD